MAVAREVGRDGRDEWVGWWGWRARRREEVRRARWMMAVGGRWADAVAGADLVRRTTTGGGMACTVTPIVRSADPGPPVTLMVALVTGQVVGDFQAQAHRLAEGMGVCAVRMSAAGRGWMRVTLVSTDALARPVQLPARPAGTSSGVPVMVGADEEGHPVVVDFRERVHLIVQGRTGSGKSRLSYSLLEQLAADPDALIAGSDPSSVLLRPFRDSRHAPWQTLGSNPAEHVGLLERLVAEMDTRLSAIPDRCDTLPVTGEHPMVFVVLEEWLALLGLAGSDRKLRDRAVLAVRRLATESGKVGMRLILLAQRAEANEMGGGLLRGQFAYRITLPVDNIDAVRLLHPTVALPVAEAHVAHGRAGVALYDAPGHGLGRLRTPQVGDYATYWDTITALAGAAGQGSPR